MKINERLANISKKIISEYLWVSKEDYPSRPDFGGPWKETEKGWSTGAEDEVLNCSTVEISFAIKNIYRAKKYNNLENKLKDFSLNASNKFNYVSDEYGKLYNDVWNFEIKNNNEKELKEAVKKFSGIARISTVPSL